MSARPNFRQICTRLNEIGRAADIIICVENVENAEEVALEESWENQHQQTANDALLRTKNTALLAQIVIHRHEIAELKAALLAGSTIM